MRFFSKVLTCFFVVFFCAESDAQLLRRSQGLAQTCETGSRCGGQVTARSQVQAPVSNKSYQDLGFIETVELGVCPCAWEIEGGGEAPIVDSLSNEAFVGQVIPAGHQETFSESDGVYPLPTLQGYVVGGTIPVYESIEGQIAHPVEFQIEATSSSDLVQQTEPAEIVQTVEPSESGSFDEMAKNVELKMFETSEVAKSTEPTELITEADVETVTVAPLKSDAPASSPATAPGQKTPNLSVLE